MRWMCFAFCAGSETCRAKTFDFSEHLPAIGRSLGIERNVVSDAWFCR
jgi:hypothetical protein